MLVRTERGDGRVFDFRETAPASAHQDMFIHDPSRAKLSGQAVAIPGEIRGFAAAHAKYGRLPWARLFEPNIQLAKQGFPMTSKLHNMLVKFKDTLLRSEGMRDTYFNADGTPKQMGDRVVRPQLAATLREIADKGPDAFYTGRIADALIAAINAHHGNVSHVDFAEYRVRESEPIESEYRGYRVLTVGPPASGAVLIEALNILSGFSLHNDNASRADSAHLTVEALKFAYASRMKLGDPHHLDLTREVQRMLNPVHAAWLRSRISLRKTHDPSFYTDAIDAVHDHGTTHISVMDDRGMAVSVTSTVNLEFGAKIMDSVTGIILNNEMDDFSIPGQPNQFSLPASLSNYAGPGKRPVSSATPVILERHGRAEIIAGGTGGSRIISSTLLALLALIDYGQSPADAVRAPRFHHQLLPNNLIAESDVDPRVVESMLQRGHAVHVMKERLYFSSVQLIHRNPVTGIISAAADPRKGGGADGY